MSTVFDHFGSEVFGGAAEGIGFPIVDLLGETEVDQFEVTLGVEEDVFGLQVAVSYAVGVVEEFENEDDFGGVEDGVRAFREAARAAQIGKYFSTGSVIELVAFVSRDRDKKLLTANGREVESQAERVKGFCVHFCFCPVDVGRIWDICVSLSLPACTGFDHLRSL